MDVAKRLGGMLDHSVLAIQGPPGAGKTYTGARMICDLVRQGKRVAKHLFSGLNLELPFCG